MNENLVRDSLDQISGSVPVGRAPLAQIRARTKRDRRRRIANGILATGAVGAVALVSAIGLAAIVAPDSEPQEASLSSPKFPSGRPSAEDIVGTTNTEASLKVWEPTIAGLIGRPEVDLIVRGSVESVEYTMTEGLPRTILEVDTTEIFFGAVDAGDQITIWEDGGFVPVREEGGREVKYVDSRFEGAEHLDEKDEVLLVLMKNPNGGDQAGSYMEVMSTYGRFALNANTGQYERQKSEGTVESQIAPEAISGVIRNSRLAE